MPWRRNASVWKTLVTNSWNGDRFIRPSHHMSWTHSSLKKKKKNPSQISCPRSINFVMNSVTKFWGINNPSYHNRCLICHNRCHNPSQHIRHTVCHNIFITQHPSPLSVTRYLSPNFRHTIYVMHFPSHYFHLKLPSHKCALPIYVTTYLS